MVLAAEVWHYWIGWALILMCALAVVGTLVGYIVKVVSLKYPKR